MMSPSKWVVLKTVYKVVGSHDDSQLRVLDSKKLTALLNSRKHKQIYRQVMSAEWNSVVGYWWPDFGRATAIVHARTGNVINIDFVMPLCVLSPVKAKPMMPLKTMFAQVRNELVRRDYAAGHLKRIGFSAFEIMPEPDLWTMEWQH